MATSLTFVRDRETAAADLKGLLKATGIVVISEETIGHGIKLYAAYRETSFSLVLYFTEKTGRSSKVVLEKETDQIRRAVISALGASAPKASSVTNPLLSPARGRTHIGIDESGKGDYFGPLVIAGVCVLPEEEARLLEMGVKDSKLIPDKQVTTTAERIKSLVTEKRFSIVIVGPEKYNELYPRVRNLNRLLAWGHARVLENLLERSPCDLAVCDQFGDESYIKNAVMEKGKSVTLIQSPRAEQDVAVAAASILARDAFLMKLGELSEKYVIHLPKGATSVIHVAKDFVRTHGRNELGKVAKLHFKTTQKVLASGALPEKSSS
jgi:ribonuclease HIII